MGRGAEVKETHKTCVVGKNDKNSAGVKKKRCKNGIFLVLVLVGRSWP